MKFFTSLRFGFALAICLFGTSIQAEEIAQHQHVTDAHEMRLEDMSYCPVDDGPVCRMLPGQSTDEALQVDVMRALVEAMAHKTSDT
jgi:hypothetical protein